MKLYQINAQLIPTFIGDFATADDAGLAAAQAYDTGLDIEDNAFFLVTEAGELVFYSSLDNAFSWEPAH